MSMRNTGGCWRSCARGTPRGGTCRGAIPKTVGAAHPTSPSPGLGPPRAACSRRVPRAAHGSRQPRGASPMIKVSKRFVDRAKSNLRRYQRILETARSRDVNESDTCVIVSDVLSDLLGYDKY